MHHTTSHARIELRIDESGVRERRIVAPDGATRALLLAVYEVIEPLVELVDMRLREQRRERGSSEEAGDDRP